MASYATARAGDVPNPSTPASGAQLCAPLRRARPRRPDAVRGVDHRRPGRPPRGPRAQPHRRARASSLGGRFAARTERFMEREKAGGLRRRRRAGAQRPAARARSRCPGLRDAAQPHGVRRPPRGRAPGQRPGPAHRRRRPRGRGVGEAPRGSPASPSAACPTASASSSPGRDGAATRPARTGDREAARHRRAGRAPAVPTAGATTPRSRSPATADELADARFGI